MVNKKPASRNKQRYIKKYDAEHYDELRLYALPKGTKEKVKAAAEAAGKSVSAFVYDLIKDKI
jgi:hypothetical protein